MARQCTSGTSIDKIPRKGLIWVDVPSPPTKHDLLYDPVRAGVRPKIETQTYIEPLHCWRPDYPGDGCGLVSAAPKGGLQQTGVQVVRTRPRRSTAVLKSTCSERARRGGLFLECTISRSYSPSSHYHLPPPYWCSSW